MDKKKNSHIKIVFAAILGTAILLGAGYAICKKSDPLPRLAVPGEEMLLEDFLDSGEASAVRYIYYWFNYRKYELASTPQNVTRVLDIVRDSGYEKLDTRSVPNFSFVRFELVTDSEKFFWA